MKAVRSGLTELLPFRPRPQPDEVFESWLVRLAAAHCLSPHEFLSLVTPSKDLEVLSGRTGVPLESIRQTDFDAPGPDSEISDHPRADTGWKVQMTDTKIGIRLPGHPYCPLCLIGDADPYFRRGWLRPYVNACEVHHIEMLDRCPHCNAPFSPRWNRRFGPNPIRMPLTCCTWCGRDLRAGALQTVAEDQLAQMHLLQEAIRSGWTSVPGLPPMRTMLFFPVLRQLFELMEDQLSNAVRAQLGHLRRYDRETEAWIQPDPGADRYRETESAWGGHWLTAEPGSHSRWRRCRIAWVFYLLEAWPDRLVRTCSDYGIYHDLLLSRMETPVPFWFWSIVMEHLHRPRLRFTEQEQKWGPQELGNAVRKDFARWEQRRGEAERALSATPSPPESTLG